MRVKTSRSPKCSVAQRSSESFIQGGSLAVTRGSLAVSRTHGKLKFRHCRTERNSGRIRRVKYWQTALAFLALLSTSVALAEDFRTLNGKEYKDATVTGVEADGIVVRTKSGITKIYFTELPKDVQERFHYGSTTPTGVVTQRMSGETAVDRFAQLVQNKLDEREAILQGKHTPGPAELMARQELNFHWAFLAVTAIIAIVLFTTVWRR